MVSRSYTFGAKMAFLLEKRQRNVLSYVEVRLAKEKVILAQKLLQCGQLSWSAGRSGV